MIGPANLFSQQLHAPDQRRKRFGEQRRNARRRGIAWSLTFEEWWAVWDASGKWPQRGKRRGQFCMSRHGDQGPYAAGNVFIQERSENDREREAKRTVRPRLCGSSNPASVLTAAKVRLVRKLLAAGWTGRAVARRLKVAETTISAIKCGTRWSTTRDE
jgi:hypothetical protein